MARRAPGRTPLRDVQEGFLGGLNVTADVSQLAPNELWSAENARLSEAGGLTRRLGTRRVSAAPVAAAPVRGGHQYVHGGTTDQLAVCNGSLYRGTFAIGMAWTLIGSGFTEPAQPAFADFTDASFAACCYIADGGALCKLSGATLTMRLASTPNVARLWVYNRRLFGTGNPQAPNTVYWSALDNGDTLGDAANGGGSAVVLADATTGAMISGRTIGQTAGLFQTRGIARFEGLTIDDIAIGTGARGFSSSVGTRAPEAFVQYGADALPAAVFLSDTGIYEIDYEWRLRTLSTKIEPIITGLDPANAARATALHHRRLRELWFALPGVGVVVYNYRYVDPRTGTGPWAGPFTGIYTSQTVTALWEAVDAGGAPVLLGGFSDGHVRQLDVPGIAVDDVATDGTGGVPYAMLAQCHRMFFGDAAREKSLKRIWVTVNSRGSTGGSLTFQTQTGAGSVNLPSDGVLTWDAPGAVWDAPGAAWLAAGATTPHVDAGGRGPYVDVTIQDDGRADSVYSRLEVAAFDMGAR